MSTTRVTVAEKMGRLLLDRLSGRDDVVGVWARQRDETAEIWILVDAGEIEQERSVRRLLWDLLDRYPDAEVDLQVSSVYGIEEQMRGIGIPGDAKRIDG